MLCTHLVGLLPMGRQRALKLLNGVLFVTAVDGARLC